MDVKAVLDATGKVLETVPEIYDDGLKPTVKESGKLLERIPRAINSALAGIDIWIANREYKVEEVKRLLAQKLENVHPDNIVPPEAYVAVPAFQAISYSMNNEELKNLYANLLSKAMMVEKKDEVHPGFVEIIKQMSPLDAENLKIIFAINPSPIARYSHKLVNNAISVKHDNVFLENPKQSNIVNQAVSISSLNHLGLININFSEQLSITARYDKFQKTEVYQELINSIPPAPEDGYQKPRDNYKTCEVHIAKGIVHLTPLGIAFGRICLID